MNEIWLISWSGYRENILYDYFFENKKQIVDFIKSYEKKIFDREVLQVQVDFEKKKATFSYNFLDEIEEGTYYLIKFNNYDKS